MNLRAALRALTVVAGLVLIAPCGSGVVERLASDDVATGRAEGPAGTAATAGVELPDAWPADVPLPGGYDVAGASSQEDRDAEVVNASLVVDAKVDDVAAFYERELADRGWAEITRRGLGDGSGVAVSAGKDAGRRRVVVAVSDVEEATTVRIQSMTEKG